jgi:hypothetical protein
MDAIARLKDGDVCWHRLTDKEHLAPSDCRFAIADFKERRILGRVSEALYSTSR